MIFFKGWKIGPQSGLHFSSHMVPPGTKCIRVKSAFGLNLCGAGDLCAGDRFDADVFTVPSRNLALKPHASTGDHCHFHIKSVFGLDLCGAGDFCAGDRFDVEVVMVPSRNARPQATCFDWGSLPLQHQICFRFGPLRSRRFLRW